MKRNSSRQSEKDLSKYNAWQQLKIFQQQRNLNSTEDEVIKNTSDDFESKTNLRMPRPKPQMKQTTDISDDCNSLVLPMQPSDTDELHSGREGSVIQPKTEVFPSKHSGRATYEATEYEKDNGGSLSPLHSGFEGSKIKPKTEVFTSVHSGRASGEATGYEKDHRGSLTPLHSGCKGSKSQPKAEVFPSVHNGRATGEATEYEKDHGGSVSPLHSGRKGSMIQPKAEVFPSVHSGRATGGATEYEKDGGSHLTPLHSGRKGPMNHEKPFEYDTEEMPMPPPLVTVSYFGDKNEIIRRRLISEKNCGKTLANKTKLKSCKKFKVKKIFLLSKSYI